MLLKSEDITYCQLVRQTGSRQEIVTGVKYGSTLFIRGNSYSPHQLSFAVGELRRKYLDQEPAIACILVESEDSLIAWHEDPTIMKEVKEEHNTIIEIVLPELVEQMKSPKGVKIQNRSQSFRLPHLRCFIGREAVDWMCKNLAIDRAQGVELGQRLIAAKLMTNLSNKQPFEDCDFHYQFFMDK